MAQRPIPPHWKEVMDRRGISSIRALAARAGVSQPAVNALVMGDARMPKRSTLAAVAGALQIPLQDVYWLAGVPVDNVGEWDPPEEANRMTPRQRRAIEELIRSMVEPIEKTTGGTVHQLHPNFYDEDFHPEQDGANLAADTSHGLSKWQVEDDMDEAADDARGLSEGQRRARFMDELGEEPQE